MQPANSIDTPDEDIELPCEAALLIRPLPSTTATGDEPIRFGGTPRLPENLDWPRREFSGPDQFIAEIDLSRLTRESRDYPTPLFPEIGTIFVFLPLSNDGLYENDRPSILYTTDDVSGLPGCEPPPDLNMLDADCPVHPDGTTNSGKLLVPQVAEVLPFVSCRAVNPLGMNFAGNEGQQANRWKQAHDRHEAELARVLREANPYDTPPEDTSTEAEQAKRIPTIFMSQNFRAYKLDWEFIFDWAKEFSRLCICFLLGELKASGKPHLDLRNVMSDFKRKRKELNRRVFGVGQQPDSLTIGHPCPISENFDLQAQRWLSLSQLETGRAPERMLAAFVDMLVEINRHYKEASNAGYRLGTRTALDFLIQRGHGNSYHPFSAACDAVQLASAKQTSATNPPSIN